MPEDEHAGCRKTVRPSELFGLIAATLCLNKGYRLRNEQGSSLRRGTEGSSPRLGHERATVPLPRAPDVGPKDRLAPC